MLGIPPDVVVATRSWGYHQVLGFPLVWISPDVGDINGCLGYHMMFGIQPDVGIPPDVGILPDLNLVYLISVDIFFTNYEEIY